MTRESWLIAPRPALGRVIIPPTCFRQERRNDRGWHCEFSRGGRTLTWIQPAFIKQTRLHFSRILFRSVNMSFLASFVNIRTWGRGLEQTCVANRSCRFGTSDPWWPLREKGWKGWNRIMCIESSCWMTWGAVLEQPDGRT